MCAVGYHWQPGFAKNAAAQTTAVSPVGKSALAGRFDVTISLLVFDSCWLGLVPGLTPAGVQGAASPRTVRCGELWDWAGGAESDKLDASSSRKEEPDRQGLACRHILSIGLPKTDAHHTGFWRFCPRLSCPVRSDCLAAPGLLSTLRPAG